MMTLRILESQWRPFSEALCARRDVESAGVVLAERLPGGHVLLARHLLAVPDDGYVIRRSDQLRIAPIALNRLIRPARDQGLSVLTVHTHPGSHRPWFSMADDAGDSRLMPSLLAQMPGPHGSIVIAGGTRAPAARLWSQRGSTTELVLRIVGKMVRTHTMTPPTTHDPWFDRQALALGAAGQHVLRSLHVAIVGLGGTGSLAFVQLAHLGVGRITVIDNDRVAHSNVSRIIGATVCDADTVMKVDVAARYAAGLGLGTQIHVKRGDLGRDIPLTAVEGCDVVLSCVDRHLPRALLNRLAYTHAIPVIDMGSAFRVDATGRIEAGAGRVVIVGPDRRCLACWGHINPHQLRTESLSPAARASQAAAGYVTGADIPQPSVIAFNTTIAGAAVVELMRLTTHYAGTENPPVRLSFDFVTGTVRRNVLPPAGSCMICLCPTPRPCETEAQRSGREARVTH